MEGPISAIETATAAERAALTASETAAAPSEVPEIPLGPARTWIREDYLDEPPSYLLAVQQIKYSFEYESPPTYFDAILIGHDDYNEELQPGRDEHNAAHDPRIT